MRLVEELFAEFDANGDGVLSPAEFKAAVQGLASMEDEDGASGVPPLRRSDAQTDRLVASLDRDGDGAVGRRRRRRRGRGRRSQRR